MKKMKKTIVAVLIAVVGCVSVCGNTVKAESIYSHDSNTKLYTIKKITKGAKQKKKGSKTDIYQIAKIKGNKITLRGGVGYYQSSDPYFSTKKKTYKLAKNCKFYYTDVSFTERDKSGAQKYKRLSKKDVITRMTDEYTKAVKEYIYDGDGKRLKKKYYVSGFHGKVYVKKGKIVAILMNGGD